VKKILGKHINLRLVNLEDAEFILNLRTKKGEFLSKTDIDVGKQIEWLKEYKKRELKNLEYYFIIEGKDLEKMGVVRVYDLHEKSFCWGSWIIKNNSPIYAAIESALLVYEFSFYELGYKKSHFDVRKSNKKVVNFHKRFGAKIVKEDNSNFYFEYEEVEHQKSKKRYSKYL
jgi:RimJ/RimL family protein N-acetyltransferase